MQPAAKLEVRSASGNLLFTLTISETESAPIQSGQANVSGNNGQGKPTNVHQLTPQKEGAKTDPSKKPIPTNGEALITDSQKRLLFRLMADQGLEGEKAHERLKQEFQVISLKEVTKPEASRAIEKFLENAKGGKPYHAAA
jgi:hypothetical protein